MKTTKAVRLSDNFVGVVVKAQTYSPQKKNL